MKPACHNREFPKTVIVQDGWNIVEVDDHLKGRVITRVPRITEIPFKFTMENGCPQWKPPAGAVVKGVMDKADCAGCKWKPAPSIVRGDYLYISVILHSKDGEIQKQEAHCYGTRPAWGDGIREMDFVLSWHPDAIELIEVEMRHLGELVAVEKLGLPSNARLGDNVGFYWDCGMEVRLGD